MHKEILEDRVLALKYRPKRFEDLIGQSTISQTLSLALDSNRLSHAYLFSGLRGSGKTSTARIMAKALLCSQGPTSKPCDICDNCKSANASKHLDIIEMDAASNRGIDDIKDLIEHTKYKPSSARFKVFIIDEVHMLTTQAFNALLKTLEEPPGFVKFILATTDPLKLPATILSRTQHFRFNKIAQSDVVHHLSYILNKENIDFEQNALEILARSGQGSLRDTLTLLDQAIIFSKGKVNTTSVVDMLGLIDPKMMDNIFSMILNKEDITKLVKELEVYEVSQICDEMTIYLKDKMLSRDNKFDLLLFDRFFRILSDAKQLLAINSDGTFVLILTFMKMVEATNLRTIDDIINQVEKIEPKKELISEKTTPIIESSSVKNPEIPQKEVVKEKVNTLIIEEETKIEEITPFDEVLIQTNNIVDLGIANSIETINYSTPFDELPITKSIENQKEEKIEEIKELEIEHISFENEVSFNPTQEVEIIPLEDESDKFLDLYNQLTAKVYDRDYSLGECFEKNFIFNGFSDDKLHIISYAQDEDRKLLFKYFGLIKAFAQDIFGSNVELDFKKEEATILEEKPLVSENVEETSSMIEDIELGSGCVADMTKSSVITPSQKELQINDILNSKMVDKAKELFDIKKITVKTRS
ncbi:DNA polymerase III subunit gamma/tau [Aliarcobacter butzleri]|uniref:DNA polymerase III subunit gamma/tau n=1 Tax=Aliarcobacter butzleri L351 TaxID=1447259 RepID=A0A837J2U7_9BACT|nr:DNA polymerase III subunit gamma/tau [Aliarcobacter butzleri]KLD99571.1 DNA polymerase III subunit gamma/tau [Aliarcobacter butzleri L351]KLE12492.1 DNA polymerase III subunit gamma/tau [Aliarcobacter butzleri L350]MDN5046354.1 DNA polymerase III subunit gamma/tau [Aliarcobacter butzleri]MDN5058195.1 DNA polymerase III subunit gamma/tau [Aliarcobacter butzleri]MDN5108612.1 DNA polymerase III subunit gamma/tau [Aliarcobacter butzleri]